MMDDMGGMGWMMGGMALVGLLIVVAVVLAIAALIKFLRSKLSCDSGSRSEAIDGYCLATQFREIAAAHCRRNAVALSAQTWVSSCSTRAVLQLRA